MAQIWEYIKIALMNIKSNKGRSVLTMLGIITVSYTHLDVYKRQVSDSISMI